MNLRLMYSPILLRSIAQVLLLNHFPSQDQEIHQKWEEIFPWLEFDENLHAKRVEDHFRGLVGLGTKPFTNRKKVTQK